MSEPTLITVARRRLRALPHLRVDAALATLIAIVQLWPLISRESPQGGPWHWWGYAVAVAASVPVVWRRRAPIVVLLASLGVSTLYDLAGNVADQPIWYGALVALYTVAAYSPPGPRIIAFGVTTAGGLLTVGSWETALRGTVLLVAAYAIGRAAATSRAHAAALEERAARMEKERQMAAELAAQRERDRIAGRWRGPACG
ncbi:DUF7134 domain-containing protein [Nonomuraea diastatica]|uniref:DUF7134 domain-containing protein n=1 Tax=Nonomuraea diastatica TaxID=1848329 RepID=A0A4R4WV21_9ACTN|nr:hypothetical protein [Nonomuraea diastatica]TDD21579.1 hypothetical protein E1294_14125 [Nonomuraea diastatica]